MLLQIDETRLGAAHDQAVLADGEAQRPQPVAVERGADDAAVREDERGRAVPRLDETRVVAVEVAHLRLQLGIALPGGRHEHRHPVPDVPPVADDELQDVVEHGRVGAALVDDRREP